MMFTTGSPRAAVACSHLTIWPVLAYISTLHWICVKIVNFIQLDSTLHGKRYLTTMRYIIIHTLHSDFRYCVLLPICVVKCVVYLPLLRKSIQSKVTTEKHLHQVSASLQQRSVSCLGNKWSVFSQNCDYWIFRPTHSILDLITVNICYASAKILCRVYAKSPFPKQRNRTNRTEGSSCSSAANYPLKWRSWGCKVCKCM